MSVRLRPLREDEYPAFVRDGVREYAADIRQNGGLSAEQAAAKAARDFTQTLPDGLATPGHAIMVVENAAGGERVGRLWFAERELDGAGVIYVYDIAVDEPHRGRGFGRAAMLALEQEVLRRGRDVIELNVFAGNDRARADTSMHIPIAKSFFVVLPPLQKYFCQIERGACCVLGVLTAGIRKTKNRNHAFPVSSL